MSRIILVQPYKMLQHAFVVALFPEHHVRIVQDLNAAESVAADGDCVIVDGAALRGRNSGEIPMPRWQLPTIWIDSALPADTGAAQVLLVAAPFTREELKSAVACLLRAQGEPERSGAAAAPVTATEKPKTPKVRRAKAAAGKEIIELVDVIEEEGETGGEGAETSSRE